MRRENHQLLFYIFIPSVIILLQSRLISMLNSLIMTTTGEMSVFSLLKIVIYIITGLLMAYVARIKLTKKRGMQIIFTIVHLAIFTFLILQYYSPILPFFIITFLHNNELFIYLWAGVYLSNLLSLIFDGMAKSYKRSKRSKK